MSPKRRKSKSKAKNRTKFKYAEMIVDAIFKLGERKGSSREAIWKFLQTRYQSSVGNKKLFLVQLKRLADKGKFVMKNPNNAVRFRLPSAFREKYMK